MYHKLTIIGNLGHDPSMKFTPTGQAVCSFSVAASEKYTGQNGQLNERVVWFRATAWDKTAENCKAYLKKGSKVFIEGRLAADQSGSPRLFTKKDGTQGASFEVTITTIKFLSSKVDGEPVVAQVSNPVASADTQFSGENIPF